MLLSFKQQWGKGFKPDRPTHFKSQILYGSKIHTLRTDKHNRWRAGRRIDFCTGLRTPQFSCFKQENCTGTQTLKLQLYETGGRFDMDVYLHNDDRFSSKPQWRKLSQAERQALAENDGFKTWSDFVDWFFGELLSAPKCTVIKKLIHWTDFRY